MFKEIIELIKKYDRIIIHRHSHPDGDAVGSQTGLLFLLRDNFSSKEIFAVGDAAGRYSFMEGSVMDEIPDEYYSGALAIVLDTSSRQLISDTRYTLADKTVRIDHHIFVEKICDTELTDTSFESCAGLIAELAFECGLAISERSAKALYTGMVTDSGRFRYDSTSEKTHRLASFLMSVPFDTSEIYRNLYSDTLENAKRRAEFIMRIQKTDAPVAYIYTTREELAATGLDTHAASRGMVNTMSDLTGIDIWVNFTECDEGVLAELRSSRYNINKIAVKYGGGGHVKASGATLSSKDEAMNMLRDLEELTKEQ
ncbi:MAG: bifunctional oligoribonuclease/PAP phosphatase NrnA [Clostridia bacterium]|nr:bifunctional oligoribonuclease/PAP phosphatase NrnA [Clostridia bacterium]MBQ7363953.1 bifunctional oligoribonuclease/PAP phosphatase NrnA [Clostridia bacterium]